MNDSNLKAAAYALAQAAPEHLGKPTMPPITWRATSNGIKVILADGRCIYGPATIAPPTTEHIDLTDGVSKAEATLAGRALKARAKKSR